MPHPTALAAKPRVIAFTNQVCHRHSLLPVIMRTVVKLEFTALLRANQIVEKINLYRAAFAKLLTIRHKKQLFLVSRRHRQGERKLQIRKQHSLLQKIACSSRLGKRTRRLLLSITRRCFARKLRGRLHMVKRRKQAIQKLRKCGLAKVTTQKGKGKQERATARARKQLALRATKHGVGQNQKHMLQDVK